MMCFNGRGTARDYAAAATWFRKAAKQGHASGQFNLGLMYEKGKGVPQDYRFAAAWYRRAADQGHTAAKAGAQQSQHQAESISGKRGSPRRTSSSAQIGREWWVVLDTEPGASLETAKRAYRLKMKHYHPDTFAGLGSEFVKLAEESSRELNAAIEEAERWHGSPARDKR
jgi:TPR repeat protein